MEEVVFKILGSSDNSINQKIAVVPKICLGGGGGEKEQLDVAYNGMGPLFKPGMRE